MNTVWEIAVWAWHGLPLAMAGLLVFGVVFALFLVVLMHRDRR